MAPDMTAPANGLWIVERLQVFLRDADDVVVVKAAPWFNPRRTTVLVGAGAFGLVGIFVVLWSRCSRQVAQREVERKMAEAEFAAILGERNRVARDIHDTLAQGLNAISMQLELAKNIAGSGSGAVLPHVMTAHMIVRSCIAEARESIWNMRSHALERTDLAGALGGVLRQMSEGLPLETKIEIAGESRRLAPQLENELLRIGQEGISNALKHSGATRLVIRLEFEAAKVSLRIADNGRGFDVGASQRATSRFGLKGIRERVQQLAATLQIKSALGQGTELLIGIAPPAAEIIGTIRAVHEGTVDLPPVERSRDYALRLAQGHRRRLYVRRSAAATEWKRGYVKGSSLPSPRKWTAGRRVSS
jgi:signal transduction histidine kinase